MSNRTHHYTGPAPRATCTGERPMLCSTDWDLVDCEDCKMRRTHPAEDDTHRQPYVYKADTGCLMATLHALSHERAAELANTAFSFHTLVMLGGSPEDILQDAAAALGINLDDENSYDSDDFPKPVPRDALDPEDYCGDCMVRYSDNLNVVSCRITGIILDGKEVPVLIGPVSAEEPAAIPGGLPVWIAQVTAASMAEALEMAAGLHADEEVMAGD